MEESQLGAASGGMPLFQKGYCSLAQIGYKLPLMHRIQRVWRDPTHPSHRKQLERLTKPRITLKEVRKGAHSKVALPLFHLLPEEWRAEAITMFNSLRERKAAEIAAAAAKGPKQVSLLRFCHIMVISRQIRWLKANPGKSLSQFYNTLLYKKLAKRRQMALIGLIDRVPKPSLATADQIKGAADRPKGCGGDGLWEAAC